MAKLIPFYFMAIVNFGLSAGLIYWGWNNLGGDYSGPFALLVMIAGFFMGIPGFVALAMAKGADKSVNYALRLMICITATLAPWFLAALFFLAVA